MNLHISNIRKILALVLLVVFPMACEEDVNPFPNVSVNLTLAIDTDLGNMTANQYKLFPNYGVGGIVVYRNIEGDFQAYDLACTHDYEKGCVLEPHPDYNEILTCPCCDSRFWLSLDGQVQNGPAKRPLKQYTVYRLSNNMIKIIN